MKFKKDGPNFILIGTSRCGTTFLHETLSRLSSYWLTPVKELHYFDFQRKNGRFNSRWRQHIKQLLKDKLKAKRNIPLSWFLKYLLGSCTDNWYLSLFRNKNGRVSGEITPGYSTLSLSEIKEVKRILPDVKLILMVRNPIDRAWSVVKKTLLKKGKMKESDIDRSDIESVLLKDGFKDRASYLQIYNKWSEVFGEDRILVCYYEDLVESPETFIEDLNSFLNVEMNLENETFFNNRVNSTFKYQLEMPDEIKKMFSELYADEIKNFATKVGGRSLSYVG